jgi:hypothetical protein
MYIAAKILLTYLAPLTAPDLCDVVYSDTGAPKVCVPHEDGAPVYDANVCCSNGTCVPSTSSNGTCMTGKKRFYCELGEVDAFGVVACYFEVPNYCSVFPCELDVGGGWQEAKICCEFGICTLYGAGSCDAANVYHCNSYQDNGDGTVTCLDWE